VNVKQREIEHKVRIRDFQNWLEFGWQEPRRNGVEESHSDHPQPLIPELIVINKM